MEKSRALLTVLAFMTLGPASGPASAGSYAASDSPTAATPKLEKKPAAQKASFLPTGFDAPIEVQAAGFKLVPLSPEVVKVDFDAYMSSIEHLQTTFTRSTDWPHKNISSADAMRDMETEWARFQRRESFAYAVLTPDGKRELGSVYVSPSPVPGHDAVVRMWVTKADYDAGFDGELYKWVSNWVRTDWPFKHVAYPGRSIDWNSWDTLLAANTPAKK